MASSGGLPYIRLFFGRGLCDQVKAISKYPLSHPLDSAHNGGKVTGQCLHLLCHLNVKASGFAV